MDRSEPTNRRRTNINHNTHARIHAHLHVVVYFALAPSQTRHEQQTNTRRHAQHTQTHAYCGEPSETSKPLSRLVYPGLLWPLLLLLLWLRLWLLLMMMMIYQKVKATLCRVTPSRRKTIPSPARRTTPSEQPYPTHHYSQPQQKQHPAPPAAVVATANPQTRGFPRVLCL